MTILFDTNPFLRILLNNLPKQADQVEQLIIKAKNKKINIKVAQITIFEIHLGLAKYYGLKKDAIIEKLEPIINADYFDIQDRPTFQVTIELYKLYKLDFVDCFLLAKSKHENIKLFTFDKNLQKLAA